MTMSRKKEIAIILAFALIASLIAYYSVSQYPSGFAFAPSPLLWLHVNLLVIEVNSGWRPLGSTFIAITFLGSCVLSAALLGGHRNAWFVSALLYAILVIANAYTFYTGWEQATLTAGRSYVIKMVAVNAVLAVICGALLLRAKERAAEVLPLYQAHALILGWLGWAALPFFGLITYSA